MCEKFSIDQICSGKIMQNLILMCMYNYCLLSILQNSMLQNVPYNGLLLESFPIYQTRMASVFYFISFYMHR